MVKLKGFKLSICLYSDILSTGVKSISFHSVTSNQLYPTPSSRTGETIEVVAPPCSLQTYINLLYLITSPIL